MRRQRSKPQTECGSENSGPSLALEPKLSYNSAAIGDKTQKLVGRRRGAKRLWAAFVGRDSGRLTRTEKVLNSNSLTGTNNRFGFRIEWAESFITFSKAFYSALNLCDRRCGFDCTCAGFCSAPFEAFRLRQIPIQRYWPMIDRLSKSRPPAFMVGVHLCGQKQNCADD